MFVYGILALQLACVGWALGTSYTKRNAQSASPLGAAAIQMLLSGVVLIAIGTTVVRALEHASDEEGQIRPGFGIATQKVTAATRLKVVNVLLTGVHEPGTSHYELMRAFVDEETLQRASAKMTALGYHTHEFGDSVLASAAARSDLRRATLSGPPMVYTEPTLKGSAYCQDGASSGVSLSI